MQPAPKQQQFHGAPAMWPPSNTVTTSMNIQNAQCIARVTHTITYDSAQWIRSGAENSTTQLPCFGLISRLSKHPVTMVRGEGGIGARGCQGAWAVIRLAVEVKVGSWILTSLKPHRVKLKKVLHSRVFYTSSKHGHQSKAGSLF